MQHKRDRPHELELDIPSVHSAERAARNALRDFARREGMVAREIETLEFVAGELLSNAVDHGGGEGALEESELSRSVRTSLALRISKEGWEMRVGDQGGGDPGDVEPWIGKHELPDLEDERGRGFYLLGQMLDSLRVEKSLDGRGLTFIAVRRYAGPAA
jgi:anti-sigma regulatory factor (Ser/Thr protein kinase)